MKSTSVPYICSLISVLLLGILRSLRTLSNNRLYKRAARVSSVSRKGVALFWLCFLNCKTSLVSFFSLPCLLHIFLFKEVRRVSGESHSLTAPQMGICGRRTRDALLLLCRAASPFLWMQRCSSVPMAGMWLWEHPGHPKSKADWSRTLKRHFCHSSLLDFF